MKIPRGGGFSRRGGAEGPGGCLRRIGDFLGGRTKFFFVGAEMSTKCTFQNPLSEIPLTQRIDPVIPIARLDV